jgi:uncharacterized membrane protein
VATSATPVPVRPRPVVSDRVAWLVLLAIVVLAAVLRFAALGDQSFWLDEAYTERILDGSLGHVVDVVPHTESTPPLYYLLAWAWTRAFGLTEPGVRSFSALAGTLTVPVVFLIGARLAGRAAGLVAAMLVAVHPLMVWYGQEARAYALLVLLCAVTLLAVVHLLEGDGGRWWAVWAVSAALAVATHYFGLLLVGPELVLLLLVRRGEPWRWAAGALVLATVAALAPLALEQQGSGHADYIGDSSLATRTAQLAKQLLVGYASPVQDVTAVVAGVLAAFAVVRVVAVADRPHARVTLLVAAIGLGSVLAALVLAPAGLDYLNTRNLLPVLLVLAVVLGVGYVVPPERAAGLVAATLLGALLLVVTILVATNPRFQRDDWRGVAAALGRPAGARAIVVSPGSGPLPLGLYQDGLRPMPARGAAVSEVDVVAIPRRSRSGGGAQAPPPGLTPPFLPPGWFPEGARRTRTYTIVRYGAPRPEPLTPSALAAGALWPGDAAVLLQRPR